MPRIAFSPKAIKSRIDDFVVAQNRAKRILSTAMHNQRLRIQQLEQYQRELLSDEREHADQLRREAATHQANDSSNEVLTDYEGQSEGYSPPSTSTSKRCMAREDVADSRSDMDAAKTSISAGKVECNVARPNRLWQNVAHQEHGKTRRHPDCYQ
jgi:hypothetical protein